MLTITTLLGDSSDVSFGQTRDLVYGDGTDQGPADVQGWLTRALEHKPQSVTGRGDGQVILPRLRASPPQRNPAECDPLLIAHSTSDETLSKTTGTLVVAAVHESPPLPQTAATTLTDGAQLSLLSGTQRDNDNVTPDPAGKLDVNDWLVTSSVDDTGVSDYVLETVHNEGAGRCGGHSVAWGIQNALDFLRARQYGHLTKELLEAVHPFLIEEDLRQALAG